MTEVKEEKKETSTRVNERWVDRALDLGTAQKTEKGNRGSMELLLSGRLEKGGDAKKGKRGGHHRCLLQGRRR